MYQRSKAGVLLFVVLLAVWIIVPGTVQGQSSGSAFQESFDHAPKSPVGFEELYPHWDVQYHVRDKPAWEAPPATQAHHGPACDPPLTTHAVTEWEDTVFLCANHFMTAANGNPGYGALYVTPPAMADWSGGSAAISFDVSTHRAAPGRDWWDVYVTPWDINMARPLEDSLPDLNGQPREAIHLRINAADELLLSEIVNHDHGTATIGPRITSFSIAVTDEEKARQRETVEVRIDGSEVSVYVNGSFAVSRTMAGPVLDAGMGVVQFGHHSYTPEKDEPENDGINTFHWDEVGIEPAREFTSIDASPRHVRGDPDEVVTLDEPAPADAMLRFAATSGQPVEVSFDGGSTWEVAQRVPMSLDRETHAQSYFTPIPQGTTEVRFQSYGSWAGGSFRYAQDFAIWSMDEPGEGDRVARQPESGDEDAPVADPDVVEPSPSSDAQPGPSQGSPTSDNNGDQVRGVVIGLSAGVVIAAGAGGLLLRKRRT